WTRLVESSLRPFYYDHSAGRWFDLPVSFSLNTTNDWLKMTVPSYYLAQYAGTGNGLFLSIAGTPIPDASTLVLFGTGLAGLAGAMRRRTFSRRR
ncbi:MAG: PEP-CTERM sorting domain-containing protein, partial [bacterium]|nr:PEP-CTERM sorting domain-containing protein [bacterium]